MKSAKRAGTLCPLSLSAYWDKFSEQKHSKKHSKVLWEGWQPREGVLAFSLLVHGNELILFFLLRLPWFLPKR